MESITKPTVDVIKSKVVVLESHNVKVFTKSLSHKKHVNGNEKCECVSPFSIIIVHCSETVSEIYWKYVVKRISQGSGECFVGCTHIWSVYIKENNPKS